MDIRGLETELQRKLALDLFRQEWHLLQAQIWSSYSNRMLYHESAEEQW